MKSNLLERTMGDVLEAALDAADDELFVINPDAEAIESLVETLDAESPPVCLFADSETLKDVLDDFLVASRAADHIEADRLEIRVNDAAANSLLVTADAVVAVVRGDDQVAGLTTDDEAFIDSAYQRITGEWADAENFNLRTPSLIRVRETLTDELGESTRENFDAVLDALETARGDGEGLDEVTISLLVAAKNEDLLYDISKWGEDVGIASKATFSRTKTRMEDNGILGTEKVPIDVGRPRLRLKLGDDNLRGADIGSLVESTQSMLE
ncbi:uncharacterized protein NP_2604A [Natronomonas pharaonis DSM 2160]|uniref:Uncharacterized protein n=1 Tax=Natronomonas pharaonis (strain ATCC 35678 / DSM 2160 / CIP 103997 / JCM 8858 / NBRC 14720 / NCIMB 2260 / Gabara) TaxID=348780 RepID=A0A1U7EWD2_NATPD|nr:DUF5821 family protein [Natronomonas pharaonis]CAI49393.1 uncharacterized protein NP_2604A [Natronomonas pharaonis DSM 2160]